MIEEKDYLMRQLHALIRLVAMLRDPFNRLREQEREDLFRQCFDIAGVDITHIGEKSAEQLADGVTTPQMLFYLSELLDMYRAKRNDKALTELQREISHRLQEQGVTNIKDYL